MSDGEEEDKAAARPQLPSKSKTIRASARRTDTVTAVGDGQSRGRTGGIRIPVGPHPLVSVIIVTYGSELTIGACLDSVLAAGKELEGLRRGETKGGAPPPGVATPSATPQPAAAKPPSSAPVPNAAEPTAAEQPARPAKPTTQVDERRLLEVIVVDNASPDGTTPRVLRFGRAVRLIANRSNRGFSKAVNQGLRASSGRFVLLLNPDCRVEPHSLATLIDFMERTPDAGACGPKMLSPGGSLQLSCRAFPSHSTALFHRHSLLTRLFPRNPHSDRYLKTRWDHSEQSQVDWVSGAAMLLRRRALRDVGGLLDEDYFLYCEDVDLCWRLREAKWATYFVPQAVVWHAIGRSARQVPLQALYQRHRSMYTFYKKHYSQDIPLIDVATFVGIALRWLFYVGLAATGRSVGHHGDETEGKRRPWSRHRQQRSGKAARP